MWVFSSYFNLSLVSDLHCKYEDIWVDSLWKRELFANNLRIWLALELNLPLWKVVLAPDFQSLKDKWYFSSSHFKQGQQIIEIRPPGLILKCEQTLFILAVSGSYVSSDLPCVHYYRSSKTCLFFFLPRSGFPLHIIPDSVIRSISLSGWAKNYF